MPTCTMLVALSGILAEPVVLEALFGALLGWMSTSGYAYQKCLGLLYSNNNNNNVYLTTRVKLCMHTNF